MRLGSKADEVAVQCSHYGRGKSSPPGRQQQRHPTRPMYGPRDAAMDAFHVLCSIVDVVSDLCVAVEFYDKGRMGFFYLVLSSLILSTVLYAICGVLEDVPTLLHRDPWCRQHMEFKQIYNPVATRYAFRKPHLCWLVGVCILPVAQFVPLLSLAQTRFEMFNSPSAVSTLIRSEQDWFSAYGAKDEDVGEGSKTTCPTASMRSRFGGHGRTTHLSDPFSNQMSSMVADGVLHRTKQLREAQARFDMHLRAHKLFYMEVVVESIPQAVIQFLAVTMHNEVTHLQLLSIALSMLSIATKVDVIPNIGSISSRMMLFRRAVCLHDLFNFFFIFSSLVAKDEAKEFPLLPLLFPDGPQGSILGMVWCVKEAVLLTLTVLYTVLFLGSIAHDNLSRHGWQQVWRDVKRMMTKRDTVMAVVLAVVCCVAALPIALLFLDMFKLSVLLLLWMAMEVQWCRGSRCLILAHMEEATTGRDWHNRLYAFVSGAHREDSTALTSKYRASREAFLTICDPVLRPEPTDVPCVVPLDADGDATGTLKWWACLPGASAPLWMLCGTAWAVGTSAMATLRKKTWLWSKPTAAPVPPNVAFYPTVPIVGVPCVVVAASVAFGLAFPVLHALFYLDRWNGLQWLCATGIMGSCAVMLWPPLLLYNLRIAAMVAAIWGLVGNLDPQRIMGLVLDHLKRRCSGAALLATILYDPKVNPDVPPVDHRVLPEDLVAVIGDLMNPLDMVGPDSSTVEACMHRS